MTLKKCETCVFWAACGNEPNSKGECGMIGEHETRVVIVPLISTNGKRQFRGIKVPDDEIPDGWIFSAAMITPHDFGCESWQPKQSEDDSDDSSDDPTLAADWWKK